MKSPQPGGNRKVSHYVHPEKYQNHFHFLKVFTCKSASRITNIHLSVVCLKSKLLSLSELWHLQHSLRTLISLISQISDHIRSETWDWKSGLWDFLYNLLLLSLNLDVFWTYFIWILTMNSNPKQKGIEKSIGISRLIEM